MNCWKCQYKGIVCTGTIFPSGSSMRIQARKKKNFGWWQKKKEEEIEKCVWLEQMAFFLGVLQSTSRRNSRTLTNTDRAMGFWHERVAKEKKHTHTQEYLTLFKLKIDSVFVCEFVIFLVLCVFDLVDIFGFVARKSHDVYWRYVFGRFQIFNKSKAKYAIG